MDFGNSSTLNELSISILEKVYKKTSYKEDLKTEADIVFHAMKNYLPLIANKDKQGLEIADKFSMFANSVNDQDSFKDMVKIAWRTIKTKTGQPQYKLSMLIIAIAALIKNVNPIHKLLIDDWMCFITQWLGTQLTIGGKGVVGDGQGGIVERIQQFFVTPYLHDFD